MYAQRQLQNYKFNTVGWPLCLYGIYIQYYIHICNKILWYALYEWRWQRLCWATLLSSNMDMLNGIIWFYYARSLRAFLLCCGLNVCVLVVGHFDFIWIIKFDYRPYFCHAKWIEPDWKTVQIYPDLSIRKTMVNCNFTLFHCRLFGTKCDKCGNSFRKDDFVMRAKTKIYHIDCFRCSSCSRPLKPGMYCILQTLQHNLAKALTQIYVICFV